MLVRRSAARLLEGRYVLDTSLVKEASRRGFLAVQSEPDGATIEFLRKKWFKRAGATRTVLHRILLKRYSHYDVNAWLHMYDLHLLSHLQLETFFLQTGIPTSFNRILDIGTGDGEIAESVLAPLLTREDRKHGLVVTETSKELCRRLESKGIDVYDVDITTEQMGNKLASFGLVSMLNVLDRTQCAPGLLTSACGLMEEEGYMLVATPLPFDPDAPGKIGTQVGKVDAGAWGREALQFIDAISGSNPELRPLGLTRLPYMSYGDIRQDLYVRDDLLLVLQKVAT